MSAAGAKLEFVDSRAWKPDIQKLANPSVEDRIHTGVTNFVINNREKLGLQALEIGQAESKAAIHVLFYRRHHKPDHVHLLRATKEMFSEKEKAYWSDTAALWEKNP